MFKSENDLLKGGNTISNKHFYHYKIVRRIQIKKIIK